MISEENLTLYFYNDGLSEKERRAIEQALQDDALLGARYAELSRQLGEWCVPDDHRAPSHVVQRFHDSIDRAARAERKPQNEVPPVHFMSFFWGAAVTAALAIGIGIGFWFSAPDPGEQVEDGLIVEIPDDVQRAVPVSFSRGLQLHLQESQWEIASLEVSDDTERALLAMQIIAQNRMFERTATMNNSPELARVLRGFEPVLLKLASDEISPQEAAALREKLAFEISVMLTKLSRGPSEVTETI